MLYLPFGISDLKRNEKKRTFRCFLPADTDIICIDNDNKEKCDAFKSPEHRDFNF